MNYRILEPYRKKKNLTKKQISIMLGREESWYGPIELGKRYLPSRYIEPLAKIFGLAPERFAKEYFSSGDLENSSKSMIKQ